MTLFICLTHFLSSSVEVEPTEWRMPHRQVDMLVRMENLRQLVLEDLLLEKVGLPTVLLWFSRSDRWYHIG